MTAHEQFNAAILNEQIRHVERRTGLGGSDMGAVLGLSQYRTPYQVWMEKTGRAEPFNGNLQTRFGTYAEEFVAREYCERTGHRVQRFNTMLRHRSAPVIGHVDRLVVPPGAKIASYRHQIRTNLGLEAKTAHALAASRGDQWGDDGTDQVPEPYLVQCAVYMALTECEYWDLACLFGNSDFRVYHLTRNNDLESMILEEAARWWRDHVVADVPPDPTSEAEARQRWAAHQADKAIELRVDQVEQLRVYAGLKRQQREIEAKIQRIRDDLIPAFADADHVTHDGHVLATYRANRPSTKTDWHAVVRELTPQIDDDELQRAILACTAQQPGARVLRLTKEIDQ